MYDVVRISSISRCWLVYFTEREVNKPTIRNSRDVNDIVHAKGLARKKRSASMVGKFLY